MGKKEEFFKWYRENASKLKTKDRLEADETANNYVRYHDDLEWRVKHTPDADQVAWMEALDQMDWEDAKLVTPQDRDTNEWWLERYFESREDAKVRCDPKTFYLHVYRVYHTSRGDVLMESDKYYPGFVPSLAGQAEGIPEVVKKCYRIRAAELEKKHTSETASDEERSVYFRWYRLVEERNYWASKGWLDDPDHHDPESTQTFIDYKQTLDAYNEKQARKEAEERAKAKAKDVDIDDYDDFYNAPYDDYTIDDDFAAYMEDPEAYMQAAQQADGKHDNYDDYTIDDDFAAYMEDPEAYMRAAQQADGKQKQV